MTQPAASDAGAGQTAQDFMLQELCPPNQAAYYAGLLDSIGYMDKIDFFIKTDDVTESFPIIIDPNDAYAIVTGNNLIQSDEINSYLFIIESASRIHLTAHNNFIRIGTNWPAAGSLSEGRLSFPDASLVIFNLPGALAYGKENQADRCSFHSRGHRWRESAHIPECDPDRSEWQSLPDPRYISKGCLQRSS